MCIDLIMKEDEIKNILKILPEQPGCYQYFDKKGEIIYVGKAKNLKKRVSSYFRKDISDRKTRLLVKSICQIKYILVESEQDALILENSLIKEYQPKYNILLKDDKSYPSISVRNEPFPRVIVTRNINKDNSLYFGPYPNVHIANTTLSMIKDIYPIRSCNLDLHPDKIRQGRYKVCLKYHIKKCKAPCVGLQSMEDYSNNIKEILSLLKGNLKDIIDLYTQEMIYLSDELRFEEANEYKIKIEHLKKYEAKHTVAPRNIDNVDVFSYDKDDVSFYVNYIHINNGVINKAMTFEYKMGIAEDDVEILSLAISDIREKFQSKAREIIVPIYTPWLDKSISITIPQKGDKKKLLDLSEKNVKQYKLDKYKQSEKLNSHQRIIQTMKEIQNLLLLDKCPIHIECFDNSNIQGSSPVGACIVFRKGKFSKKDYRKFHIKTVSGSDDYKSMTEVVYRHYKRYLEQGNSIPDLIVADGGINQIKSIRKALKEIGLSTNIVGLAKDDRHRTRSLISENNGEEVFLKYDSPVFRFFETLQNEVHRFAITFHRDVRSKNQIISNLDYIDGIGKMTKEKLLNYFGSVDNIKNTSLNELSKIIGFSKAKKVINYFCKLDD